jgi:cell wall-active antibiotic response 4TMS protein YvqF
MSDRIRCTCQRCSIRGLMGPVIVVTVGVLFLLSEMRGGYFDFGNTYPVILIVIGLISLASAMASSEGHVSSASATPPSVPPSPGVPAPPSSAAPTSYPGQGQ